MIPMRARVDEAPLAQGQAPLHLKVPEVPDDRQERDETNLVTGLFKELLVQTHTWIDQGPRAVTAEV
jgi:hypothetical protein